MSNSVFETEITVPTLKGLLRALAAEPAIRVVAINEALRKGGKILVPAIKAETPVSPHHQSNGRTLRGSTAGRIGVEDGDQVLLISQNARTAEGVSYGIFVREGTVAHDIFPRKAKALRWYAGSTPVFATHVHHPGMKPNPYHIRALERVRPELEATAAKINDDTAARIAAIGKGGANV